MTGNVRGMVVVTRQRGSSLLYRLGYLLDAQPISPGERTPRDRVPIVTDTDVNRQPYITEMVHYESSGHPTGEPKACRPAVVIEVGKDDELLLAVFRANGILFETCRHEEDNHLGGTWHYAHD